MSERTSTLDASRAGEIGSTKPGQVDSRVIHDGKIVNLAIDTARFPDGSTGQIELVRHSGAAAVVAVLGDAAAPDPIIVLLRQFRYAAGGNLFEVPAGRPDQQGEPWEKVAARELEEETGYAADKLTHLTTIYTTPGFTDERIHLFLAHGLSRGTINLDHDEFVEVVTLPLSQVLEAVRDGRIIDAKSIVALLYYATYHR